MSVENVPQSIGGTAGRGGAGTPAAPVRPPGPGVAGARSSGRRRAHSGAGRDYGSFPKS